MALANQKMNRSLLRTYALIVCVITGFSVVLIAGVPLWNSLIHSAQAIEQHDVYQFMQQGCVTCTTPLSSPKKPDTIAAYEPAAPAPEPKPQGFLSEWMPSWVFTALRVIIGLVGLLIFAVHWRLYRNLGYA